MHLKLTKLKVINILTFFLTFNVLISYYSILLRTKILEKSRIYQGIFLQDFSKHHER